MIVDTTRSFVERELYPHETVVERTGHLPMELVREIQQKAIDSGLYAANMPEDVGGAGLDTLSWLLGIGNPTTRAQISAPQPSSEPALRG